MLVLMTEVFIVKRLFSLIAQIREMIIIISELNTVARRQKYYREVR